MIEYNSKNARIWSRLGPSGAVGTAAMELGECDEKTVFLTADLCFFSGLERFKVSFPDRLYNFGIAEQNMLGAAGGLAKEGFIPFATTYASFATARCLDQVRVNMAYMNLPIKLIGLASGFGAGILGATHMSIEDIAIMRSLPNMTVISPADCSEVVKSIIAASTTKEPTYIRLDGQVNSPIVYKEDYDFQIGKAVILTEGKDLCFIATGAMVSETLQAAKKLEEDGISCSVINMHTIKPLDTEIIDRVSNNHKLIVTAEEHSIFGGLGGTVAEYMIKKEINVPTEIIGIEDFFPLAGDYRYQMRSCGLEAEQIYERVKMKYQKCL